MLIHSFQAGRSNPPDNIDGPWTDLVGNTFM
jgi:hypothetical protein